MIEKWNDGNDQIDNDYMFPTNYKNSNQTSSGQPQRINSSSAKTETYKFSIV